MLKPPAKESLMKIRLTNVGKRFNSEWIFRDFSYEFKEGVSYAVTGPNGSGKSTLLQIIAGATIFNEGTIDYINDTVIPAEEVFKYVSVAAPYLELIEEFTLLEFLNFHGQLKSFRKDINIPMIIKTIGLEKAAHKQIRYYSSGMKQRVKLAQAVFSDVPVVLLDEPNTNLDVDGIDLYQQLIKHYCKERLVIVSSNDRGEYDFCEEVIDIGKYK